MELAEHRPAVRIAFNASVFAVAAAGGGLAIAPLGRHGAGALLLRMAICAFVNHLLNMLLTTAAVARSSGRPYLPLIQSNLRWTSLPFALMASAALMLVVLWQRSPFLSAALVGPLLAIALYQRSAHRELRATRLALTDPLTSLGNHRHFHDRLRRELAAAELDRSPLTLCLVDIDDFKVINDRFGHP